MYVIQHCFICRPSDPTVLEDAGIEPRIVATQPDALTTRLDVIHRNMKVVGRQSKSNLCIRRPGGKGPLKLRSKEGQPWD
jgi:hypothetical protein